MQLFLDSANVDEIKESLTWGVISGVTTNPTLLSREEGSFEPLVRKICSIMAGDPVSLEVLATTAEAMVGEAERLAALAPNVVVKIPMGVEGLKAVHCLRCREHKVPCNVTLVFSVNQAILAARAGAAYISPFVGRLDDIGWDGAALVEEITTVFRRQQIDTPIIAASIRHPQHVQRIAAAGAHIATVPFSVLKQMAAHPLTSRGIELFLADWARSHGEERL
ncbi:MAG: fructose-6-phosphate aldolase [Bacillota bacterium]